MLHLCCVYTVSWDISTTRCHSCPCPALRTPPPPTRLKSQQCMYILRKNLACVQVKIMSCVMPEHMCKAPAILTLSTLASVMNVAIPLAHSCYVRKFERSGCLHRNNLKCSLVLTFQPGQACPWIGKMIQKQLCNGS